MTMTSSLCPPTPDDPADAERWDHSRERRRFLYGEHEGDLQSAIRQDLGTIREQAWGKADLSSNPFLAIWTRLAALFNAEPQVTGPANAAEFLTAVTDSGLWSLMQRVQRDTLGLREMLLRVDVEPGLDGDAPELLYRPVFPDMVTAQADPRRPQRPVRVEEWQPLNGGWVRHVLDVQDPAAPVYQVLNERGDDLSEVVLGGDHSGANYPYRNAWGRPVLPYVMFHASETGFLWDPKTMREIIEGSKKLSIYLTYWGHVVRNVAWAQRWAANAKPLGVEAVDDGSGTGRGGRAEIVTDPATLLMLQGIDEDGKLPIQIGQWTSPVDPEAMLRAIAMYERRILSLAGVKAPDVTRTEADIRSGYSLAVAREDVTELQGVYKPLMRRALGELLATSAALWGAARGSRLELRARDFVFKFPEFPDPNPNAIQNPTPTPNPNP